MSAAPKSYSLSELRDMARNRRSWKKFVQSFRLATGINKQMTTIQRDAAFSHFLGGCEVILKDRRQISREDFVRLLSDANEFGNQIK